MLLAAPSFKSVLSTKKEDLDLGLQVPMDSSRGLRIQCVFRVNERNKGRNDSYIWVLRQMWLELRHCYVENSSPLSVLHSILA